MYIPIQLKTVHGGLVILIVIVVTLAGCITTPQQPGIPLAAPVPEENRVTIQNFVFSPPTMNVSPGTRVTWVNKDTVLHQVTSDASGSNAEGAIFSSRVLATGESYSFTFTGSGTYLYHCSIHPLEKGTINVS
jgi:plastocyanin